MSQSGFLILLVNIKRENFIQSEAGVAYKVLLIKKKRVYNRGMMTKKQSHEGWLSDWTIPYYDVVQNQDIVNKYFFVLQRTSLTYKEKKTMRCYGNY